MLTTVDNPYNPFTEWDEWFDFDRHQGYHTPAFLARIAKVSSDLPEPEQQRIINEAIDEIVEENVSGMWRKVSANDFTATGGEG